MKLTAAVCVAANLGAAQCAGVQLGSLVLSYGVQLAAAVVVTAPSASATIARIKVAKVIGVFAHVVLPLAIPQPVIAVRTVAVRAPAARTATARGLAVLVLCAPEVWVAALIASAPVRLAVLVFCAPEAWVAAFLAATPIRLALPVLIAAEHFIAARFARAGHALTGVVGLNAACQGTAAGNGD